VARCLARTLNSCDNGRHHKLDRPATGDEGGDGEGALDDHNELVMLRYDLIGFMPAMIWNG
jgi:hypothetical protein